MFPVGQKYYNLDKFPLAECENHSAASPSIKERLSRLFCCFTPSKTLEDRESQSLASKVEKEPRVKKKKSKKEERSFSIASTDSDKSSDGSRSPSLTSGSRTPSPLPRTPLVDVQPVVSYGTTAAPDLLQRLQRGPDQPMARAIHAQVKKTVVAEPVIQVQPRAETIERLVKQIDALSLQTPAVKVSHQIGDHFQVNVDYIKKDGPMPGSTGRKTFLIPVEEIRILGSSSSTAVLDLGAHLRAHLRENFSQIKIA